MGIVLIDDRTNKLNGSQVTLLVPQISIRLAPVFNIVGRDAALVERRCRSTCRGVAGLSYFVHGERYRVLDRLPHVLHVQCRECGREASPGVAIIDSLSAERELGLASLQCGHTVKGKKRVSSPIRRQAIVHSTDVQDRGGARSTVGAG